MLDILREQSVQRPWATYFLRDYPLNPGNLGSVCRIGFVPFERCIQDRYFYIDYSRTPEILAAGGITTQIHWDFNPSSLPDGWQGTVKQSYADAQSKKKIPNTKVALLAFTIPRFRNMGMSGNVLTKMCHSAQQHGYPYLLVPALPPTQFQKAHVQTPIEEISKLRREDGKYQDYWIRLHHEKGATVIGHCAHSHRFILTLEDFYRYVSSDPVTTTGEHIVRLDKDHMLGPNSKNMWQLVYVDIERSFVTFNWGCVWVQYDLKTLNFSSSN